MTIEKILNAKYPSEIFSNDISKCKKEYLMLVKKYHPDVIGEQGNEVIKKLNQLYTLAEQMMANGEWVQDKVLNIETQSNKEYIIRFYQVSNFELGKCYVTDKNVVYILNEDKEKYYNNAVKMIKNIKFPDAKMEKNIGIYLPKNILNDKLKNGKYFIATPKTADVYPLKNLLNAFNGIIEPKHSAWIITRLSNIACYLKYSNIVHNGIALENCYASPEYHSIMLYGGWWYSTYFDEKLLGTTKEIYDIMPIKAKNNKKADFITDLESIKLIGSKVLGCKTTREIKESTYIPEPIKNFIIGGSSNNAYDELAKWDIALEKAYGERRFIEMKIKKDDIYREEL